MEPIDRRSMEMLGLARAKAEALLHELLKHQAEILASPPDLPPDQLQAGRTAMENAVAAARQAYESLDGALRIASTSSN